MNCFINRIIVDGVKYIKIFYDYDYKKASFNAEVYYTLMDICNNIIDDDIFHFAWKYLHMLCNDKHLYKGEKLTFSSMLESEYYIKDISCILNWIKQDDFKFKEMPKLNYINMNNYIKFDDWWHDFKKLKDTLKQKLNDITNNK